MVGTNNFMALRRKAKDPALSSAGGDDLSSFAAAGAGHMEPYVKTDLFLKFVIDIFPGSFLTLPQ